MAATLQSVPIGASIIRVPVGVESLMQAVPSNAEESKGHKWCLGTITSTSATGSVLANFALGWNGNTHVIVSGFTIKRGHISHATSTAQLPAGFVHSRPRAPTRPGIEGGMRHRDPEAVHAATLVLVTNLVEDMLGVKVAPDQPLMEAGLDSLGEFPVT
jgi:hypothetical protein